MGGHYTHYPRDEIVNDVYIYTLYKYIYIYVPTRNSLEKGGMTI